jgi:predicted phosphoribosyltransferase
VRRGVTEHTHSGKSSKTPLELLAIGYWYEYFEQVSDEEVAERIERSRGAKVGETKDSDT